MKRNRLRFLLIGAIVMTAVVGCASGEDRRLSNEQSTYLAFADHAVVRVSDVGSRLNAITASQDRIVER